MFALDLGLLDSEGILTTGLAILAQYQSMIEPTHEQAEWQTSCKSVYTALCKALCRQKLYLYMQFQQFKRLCMCKLPTADQSETLFTKGMMSLSTVNNNNPLIQIIVNVIFRP